MNGLFTKELKPSNGLNALTQSIKDIKKSVENISIPETIEVNNIDFIKKYLRVELATLATRLMGVFRLIQIPNTVKISNFPAYPDTIKVTEMTKLVEVINDLRAIMAQLDFSPTINIPEVRVPKPDTPIVNVPTPKVSVEPIVDLSELLKALKPLSYISNKAGKPITVQLSDGVRFVKALKDVVGKQEKLVHAFASSNGMSEGEFQNKFRASTRANALVSGRKAIAAAGTAERLVAASIPCMYVEVGSDTGNSGEVVVGGSGVVAAAGSQEGTVLFGGNPATRIYIDDVYKLWADSQINNDAIIFNYYTY